MTDETIHRTEELPKATLADLPEKLRQGAVQAGWDKLMPVQAQAIPVILAGRDILLVRRFDRDRRRRVRRPSPCPP